MILQTLTSEQLAILVCAIIAAFVIYLMSQNCKIADSELELYNVSEEHVVSEDHNNESLHEDYKTITLKYMQNWQQPKQTNQPTVMQVFEQGQKV